MELDANSSADARFENDVRKARKKGENWKIAHACEGQALFIYKQLFEAAIKGLKGEDRIIRIVSNRYRPDFYGKLTGLAKKAMQSGVRIEALALSPSIEVDTNDFLRAIKEDPKELGTVFVAPTPGFRAPSFVVVGKSMYRTRPRQEDAKATANFANPVVAAFLISEFDNLKAAMRPERSTHVEAPL